ncbi:isocitrate lyase/phosphoenolpyruvate mutase family protein [Nocardia sp. NBC_00565]|uniref:isocitrate lyase/PEP mutase family protein n=1 Tax=Nocardia sp. NBC_00565 TaxID=2975993 RepID=UPI002E804084|nr:isocitrate lyase/phosphoenolpyruvate mutase family protein [Nocardia sp. NBC_00565]WUC04609.1 isocitrate lyase/phosphoenolpyruvate mutase family protein [Nocardia sp. NBC_00565]
MITEPDRATKAFHDLHHRAEPLVLPNAWDFGSAAVLAAAGFPAIGTTSLGVAVAAGLADGTGVTRDETLSLATRLARLPVPVTVDIEGGFSEDSEAVAEYVTRLAALGIAGVNLEDGRADTALADPGHQAELIAAIKSRTPELFVNARVDTYWLRLEQDSTLVRAERYAQAGADGIFVPGVTDPAAIERIVAAVPLPVNMLFSAVGPSIAELAELGVRRVSMGSLLYRAALAGIVDVARAVRDGRSVRSDIPSYREIQAITE